VGGIKVNDSLTSAPSARYHHFITHVNSRCCFLYGYFHSDQRFIVCKGPIILVQLPLNGSSSGEEFSRLLFLRGTRHGAVRRLPTWRTCSSMSECAADVVIVPDTITRCSLHPLFLFYLKYVEQKRKEISPKGGGPPPKSIKSSIKMRSLLYEDITLLFKAP